MLEGRERGAVRSGVQHREGCLSPVLLHHARLIPNLAETAPTLRVECFLFSPKQNGWTEEVGDAKAREAGPWEHPPPQELLHRVSLDIHQRPCKN